jgi:stage II sporulation protein D
VDQGAATRAAAAAWYAGDTPRAIALYERLLAEDPRNDELRLNLLLLLREVGDLDRALLVGNELGDSHAAEQLMTRVLAGAGRVGEGVRVGEGEGEGVRVGKGVDESDVPGSESGASGSSPPVDPRQLFWQAAAEMIHGDSRIADELFREVIAAEPHFPHAHLFLGILARTRGDWTKAIENLTIALRQDANLTMAFQPLAEARYARGETREAYRLLSRAVIALPWNDEIRATRAAWEERYPELVAVRDAEVERRRTIAQPPVVAVTPVEREAIPRVRVGLAEGLSSVHLKTGGPFRIVTVPDDLAWFRADVRLEIIGEALRKEPLATGGRGMILHVAYDRESDEMVVRELSDGRGDDSEEAILLRDDRPLRLVYENAADTTIVFDLAYGHGQFSAGREDRSYRGDMEFIPALATGPAERFSLVNDVNVEEYLYSVVPSEMPASWPEAALEAQTIAARSYTLHRRTRFHPRGFDLLSSVASAYYRGVTGEHPRTTAAVESTRGLVLADGGGTLDAVYSANHAGYSESSESVWGSVTSLVGVADPHLPALDEPRPPAEVYRWILDRPESYSAHPDFVSDSAYRWSLLVAREDIERRIAATGVGVGQVLSVLPGTRGATGRVEQVRVVGTSGETIINRDAIRSRLGGLRSNLFVVSPRYEERHRSGEGDDDDASGGPSDSPALPRHFYFEGAGWGHGVGMCQTGAAGMAAEGFGAQEILGHYYPLNELVTWY